MLIFSPPDIKSSALTGKLSPQAPALQQVLPGGRCHFLGKSSFACWHGFWYEFHIIQEQCWYSENGTVFLYPLTQPSLWVQSLNPRPLSSHFQAAICLVPTSGRAPVLPSPQLMEDRFFAQLVIPLWHALLCARTPFVFKPAKVFTRIRKSRFESSLFLNWLLMLGVPNILIYKKMIKLVYTGMI